MNRAARLRAARQSTQEDTVKKLFVVLLAAGAGFAAWQKTQSGKSEQKLWAEATDKVS